MNQQEARGSASRGGGDARICIALLALAALLACGDAGPRAGDAGCAGVGIPEIIAEVRDQDGRPAATGATLAIRSAEYAAENVGVGDGTNARVDAGEGRGGVFTVTVTKPGYDPVTIEKVRVPVSRLCGGAERPAHVKVTLRLRPDAPPVRSVTVHPRSMAYGPGLTQPMQAHVDAAPGVPATVRWRVSDTTVATISRDGWVTTKCLPSHGAAVVTAISTADSTRRDSGHLYVSPQERPPIRISHLTRPDLRPISGDRLAGVVRVSYTAEPICRRIARVELVLARGGREVVAAASAPGVDNFGELRFDTARHPVGSYEVFARLVPADGSAPVRSNPIAVRIARDGG